MQGAWRTALCKAVRIWTMDNIVLAVTRDRVKENTHKFAGFVFIIIDF